MHSLPFDALDSLQEIATLSVCDLLQRLGSSLTFEDLEILDNSLDLYGSDAAAAQAAIHSALEAFLPELDSEMADFATTEDFDEFESKLKKMVARHAYNGDYPSRDLRQKRESLEEDEWKLEVNDAEPYSGSLRNYASELEASNVEIKSIFAGLGPAE
jgi:hypothetical protein